MAVLAMIGSLLAIVGYYLFVLPPASGPARDAPPAELVAATMQVHQKAAVDWCLRTGCPDGPVPSAGLSLPPGYATAPWVRSVAAGGRVSTFVAGLAISPAAVAGALGDATLGGPGAGLATAAGGVATRGDGMPGRVSVPVVPGVPPGAPVISQRVR
ncbi:MAG: hypothetical protein F8N37_01855 [Telmatospirillum sp.]|nr:hypothetical protein [Telmatospirillum sp.]